MEGGTRQALSADLPSPNTARTHLRTHTHARRQEGVCVLAPLPWKGWKPPRQPERVGTRRPRAVESRA